MNRKELKTILSRFYPGLRNKTIRALISSATAKYIKANTVLFKQGEQADNIYIIYYGRLVVTNSKEGKEEFVAEMSEGDLVGEFALFSTIRTATVTALRDSLLYAIDIKKLEGIMSSSSRLMFGMFKHIYHRISHEPQHKHPSAATISFVSYHHDYKVDHIIDKITTHLGESACFTIESERLARQLLGESKPQNQLDEYVIQLAKSLAAKESQYKHIVFKITNTINDAAKWCINQSGLVFLLIKNEDVAEIGKIETEIMGLPMMQQKCILLVVHEYGQPCLSHYKWRHVHNVKEHLHFRMGHLPDYHRIVRYITGHSIGLVLGGGGARAFSQIGVVKHCSKHTSLMIL